MKSNLLLVDDDPFTRKLFENLLRDSEVELTFAANMMEARQAFRVGDFNLAILDQRLPDGNGLDLFTEIRKERPRQMAVMITGYADVKDAVRAVQEGLFDYLTKPFENLEELEAVIGKALEMDRAYREIANLREILTEKATASVVIHQSAEMSRLLAQAQQAAPLDTTVLIEGESGTGKEGIARLLHILSKRSGGPWKVLNCGALPEALVEASLFGYEKGAFTGAIKSTPGFFEEANNGTILLDEIADMSPKLQVSLLRVLQEGTFTRLGSTVQRSSNFRLVCATNKPLEQEMNAGRFRPDLYYRVNVVMLTIPPLRQRRVDILPLALHFLEYFNHKFGKKVGRFTPETIAVLEAAYWAGNVRELKHTIERAVVTNTGGAIVPGDLRISADQIVKETPTETFLPYREARQRFEHDYFRRLLQLTSGNISESARLSGLARQNIYTHLNSTGLVIKS